MKITNKEYGDIVAKKAKTPAKAKNMVLAFVVGGFICVIGQVLYILFESWGLDEEAVKTAVPITLIALGALFTGLKIYDNMAKHAGAGTIVPITGFANAVVSPAMEFKSEGHVLGIGAKMFALAGPVIVFGVSASVVYGLVIWIFRLF